MQSSLCNHQSVDPIRSQILHVAVEKTSPFALKHAVPISNDRPDRRTRALDGDFSDCFGYRSKVGISSSTRSSRLNLVRVRKLAYGNLVLVGMSGPRAVHQTTSLVLLVFRQNLQCALVQPRINPARIQRGHTANRERSAPVTDLHHQLAKILKEGNVVRYRVSIRQYPTRIHQVEMNEARHVVPPAEIQSDKMLSKVEHEFFHLISKRVRLYERHALDEVRRKTLCPC